MTPPALFTDADNTLWDTDEVYMRAQLGLFAHLRQRLELAADPSNIDALIFIRNIDQKIAAQHPHGLKYPPSLLALGLRRALEGDTEGATNLSVLAGENSDDVAAAVEEYEAALTVMPRLRQGVMQGLRSARDVARRVLVITEGKLERCVDLLARHGLSSFVSDCISVDKTVSTYRSLALSEQSALMVGDQTDRDIQYAAQAGLQTCYFPGGFRPYWLQGVKIAPDFEIRSYGEIPGLLTTIAGQPLKYAARRAGGL
jgi:putative hydrolase of the HAD superfamily